MRIKKERPRLPARPSKKRITYKSEINPNRLFVQEIDSINRGMNRYFEKLELLENDTCDFATFDGGPGGIVDRSRKDVMRRIAELRQGIGT
jgi:hypothetical protein